MVNIGLGLLNQVADIAERAGREILKIYDTDFNVETKGDQSPVTEADRVAEDLIAEALLREITGEFKIIGEEAVAADGMTQPSPNHPFWLVDPLDGTKEFVKRSGEFTVNIALIENALPVMGIVHLPVLGETFMGANLGSFKKTGDEAPHPIQSRGAPAKGLTAAVSRSHGAEEADEFLEKFTIARRIGAGSSLKFCRVAEGAADIYPRFGRTMEWDTAAGHAVVRFAGGNVVRTDGAPLTYGKPGLENPHFIVVGQGVDLGF
ncbi:MAG: 3'(2'),5'-bisphosphate nucleotidase CysQ [Rhodospirillaceae bacterium]